MSEFKLYIYNYIYIYVHIVIQCDRIYIFFILWTLHHVLKYLKKIIIDNIYIFKKVFLSIHNDLLF